MARRKGSPRDPGSGRKKGTPNKRSQVAADTLDELGFNGLAEMFRMWGAPGISEATRTKLLCEMTQYQFPKLKSLERSAAGGAMNLVVELVYGKEPA